MAELLSIKERIETVIAAVVEGITGIGTVYRWDQRGMLDPDTGNLVDNEGGWATLKNGDALLICDQEEAEEGGEGGGSNGGWTTKTLKFQVQVKILQSEPQTADVAGSDVRVPTARLANRWLLRLETALMTNPQMTEPAGVGKQEQLAIDSRITGTLASPREEGQREAMAVIDGETTYMHKRADPSVGPGVTQYTTS